MNILLLWQRKREEKRNESEQGSALKAQVKFRRAPYLIVRNAAAHLRVGIRSKKNKFQFN